MHVTYLDSTGTEKTVVLKYLHESQSRWRLFHVEELPPRER